MVWKHEAHHHHPHPPHHNAYLQPSPTTRPDPVTPGLVVFFQVVGEIEMIATVPKSRHVAVPENQQQRKKREHWAHSSLCFKRIQTYSNIKETDQKTGLDQWTTPSDPSPSFHSMIGIGSYTTSSTSTTTRTTTRTTTTSTATSSTTSTNVTYDSPLTFDISRRPMDVRNNCRKSDKARAVSLRPRSSYSWWLAEVNGYETSLSKRMSKKNVKKECQKERQ